MINLKKTSGLDLKYNEVSKKLISKTLSIPKPQVRKLSDMKKVLMYNNSHKNKELYYIYRNISLIKHKKLFKDNNMRYDITIIPSSKLGNEFIKTLGHHHKGIEVYDVLYGEALYIFQNKKEFLVIHAKAGTRVYVPNEYWHVTINHGNKILVMANLVPKDIKTNYEDITNKHGMAYYYVAGNKFVKNKNFKISPKIKIIRTKRFKTPIYLEFVNKAK